VIAPALAGAVAAEERPTWIQTYTGRAFDLLNPDPSVICVEDIAHHLALINRFTGASRVGYTVAQHSVRVAQLLPARLRLAGLLHDAAEAYTGDWSSPLKMAVRAVCTDVLERIHLPIECAVEARFGLELTLDDRVEIKRADLVMLATERRDLMGPSPRPDWAAASGHPLATASSDPRLAVTKPWSADEAEFNFTVRFSEWGGK
jgi:hypothetical protein